MRDPFPGKAEGIFRPRSQYGEECLLAALKRVRRPAVPNPHPWPAERKHIRGRVSTSRDVQVSPDAPTWQGGCLRPRYERFRATRQRVVPACVQSGNRRTNNRLAVLAFPRREQQGRTITHCSSLMSLVQPRSFCNNGSLLNLGRHCGPSIQWRCRKPSPRQRGTTNQEHEDQWYKLHWERGR